MAGRKTTTEPSKPSPQKQVKASEPEETIRMRCLEAALKMPLSGLRIGGIIVAAEQFRLYVENGDVPDN